MKTKFLVVLSMLTGTFSLAQEKRWNLEVNYTVIPEDGFGGSRNYLDSGVKYRFVKAGVFDIGFGVNGGFWTDNIENTGFESRRDKEYLIQPRFFTEFQIPGWQRLRPSLGLGYSFVYSVSEVTFSNGNEDSNGGWGQGFNFNLGLSYDISTRFFVQAQYDFIDNANFNINNFRIGLGFRF